jgi:hypothetical protein
MLIGKEELYYNLFFLSIELKYLLFLQEKIYFYIIK